MAFSGENSNKTWNRVNAILDTLKASPAARAAFKDLKMWLATQKGNPDLQFFSMVGEDLDAAGGTVYLSGAAAVYGAYFKKRADSTRNTIKLYDDATDDTTAGDATAAFDLPTSGEENFQIYPQGLPLGTGLVGTVHTTLIGTTDGAAANAGDGFVIIAAS